MHNQPYVGRIALCTRKKTAKIWRNKALLRYYILLTKITALQNEVALNYHSLRGLYFLAVIFAVTIV